MRGGRIIKAWFKNKAADRVLAPVREAIVELIENGCGLLDVGCGTGDLLFRAKDKIRFGLGVDLDPAMIRFAEARKRSSGCDHLEFVHEDIRSYEKLSNHDIDVASSTLCLHEMREEDAVDTLKLLAALSSKILVADYTKPKLFWSRVFIELDEIISGHYGRFRQYRENGYLPYLAGRAGLMVVQAKETPIDGILLWELKGKGGRGEISPLSTENG
ncbi:MAG: hypothetical protein Kow006_11880 [Gammaproteobacteria bacterium]